MKRAWCVAAFTVAGSCCSPSPKPVVAPTPVAVASVAPAAPAFDPPLPVLRLPRHFLPTSYAARLAIDPSQPDFDGEVTITGTLDRRSAVIWLNASELAIGSATATNGAAPVALTATPHGEYLELRPAQPLDPGTWTLHLVYRGHIQQNAYQGAFVSKQGDDRYVTTQFESTAARMVFPCFDEPDVKVPWQLVLDVPKDLVAVSNTPIANKATLDATHVRVAFDKTRALPSYLIAFGVGPYEIVDAGHAKSGVPLRIVVPRGKTKAAAYVAGALPKIVDTLEAWFAIPYPYPKLDIVVVPSARGLAMENAGMITADARYTLLDHPAPFDEYGLVSVIGHETAHQWFGDLVTADWWDDIWLNESFATWMEDKILAAYDPSWPNEAVEQRAQAFGADELLSARKIHQPIDTPDAIHNIFDAITYPKGATVLRMIEHEVGAAAFQSAIRDYLRAHADGNAKAADVFAAIEHAAGKPIAVTEYFEQAGLPDVAMTLACNGGKAAVELAQSRYVPLANPPADTSRWTIPVCIAYAGEKGERREACTHLADATGELALDAKRCPAWFAPAGDYGYYRAKLEPKALEAIRDKAWPKLTAAERISIYRDAWAHVRTGAVPVGLGLDLASKLRSDADPRAVAIGISGARPPETVVPDELLPAARARVRAAVEPFAKKLGLAPKPTDTYSSAEERGAALGELVWSGSHVLDAAAKRLVAAFRDLPTGSRGNVIALAVNADPNIAAHMLVELATEPDRANRDAILYAFDAVKDPTRRRALLTALVDAPSTVPEDLLHAIFGGDHAGQLVTAAFIRGHVDKLLAQMPPSAGDDFPLALALMYPLFTCDAKTADDTAAFVRAHFATLSGATLAITQAIEFNAQCIAEKQLLEPSVRAWLKSR